MNKTMFRIMPTETYRVSINSHDIEISGIDILAILQAAFDEDEESYTDS